MFKKKYIRLLNKIFLILIISPTLNLFASEKFYPNVHYVTHNNATENKSTQIIYFFNYSCPVCQLADEVLEKWHKEKTNIPISYLAAAPHKSQVPYAKLFYINQKINFATHKEIFKEIKKMRKNIKNDEDLATFIAAHGIDKQKALELCKSPEIIKQVETITNIGNTYEFRGLPSVMIIGKQGEFVTDIARAGSFPKFLEMLDFLIQQQEKPLLAKN